MASGDAGGSRPRDDHSGVSFRCKHHGTGQSHMWTWTPWVVVLDTSVVPDVLDLSAFYDDAEPVRVLPGRAQDSV